MDFMILNNINEENYLNDYLKKKSKYKNFINVQIGLKDFYTVFTPERQIVFNEEVKNIKHEFLYKSESHGKKHNIRVMLFSYYLSIIYKINEIDLQIIFDASKYHDVGRTNDLLDESHGRKSAELIDDIVENKIYNNKENLNLLKSIIHIHSINEKEESKIIKKYNIKDTERFKKLYYILKDSDGLDRVRLSINNKCFSALNPNYLRLEESKKLIKTAHIINEIEGENYV